MGVLRLFYVILHFVVTYLHHFHVALNGLIDRLKPVLKNRTYRLPTAIAATTAKLGATKTDEQFLLQTVASELKQLKKLPTHVACVFTEQDVNIDKIVTIVEWCAVLGISCISLYDYAGITLLLHLFLYLTEFTFHQRSPK